MRNRWRLVNALLYAAAAVIALAMHHAWIAALACGAATRVAPKPARWPLLALTVALAIAAVLAQPFAEGQALLSDLVFPLLLVLTAAMAPVREASPWWPASIVAASLLFLLGSRDNALTGEVAAGLCLAAGQWRRR